MQFLEPLGIIPIAFAARDGFAMPRIDQRGRDAMLFQKFVERDPLHTGRFECYRINLTGEQPVNQGLKVLGKCRECPHGLGIAISWDGDDDFVRSNVDTGSIWMDGGQPFQMELFWRTLMGHTAPRSLAKRNA
jgi:hypothetical protein